MAEPPVISTAKGSVHIVQCDASGKFIKIKNTGSNASIYAIFGLLLDGVCVKVTEIELVLLLLM